MAAAAASFAISAWSNFGVAWVSFLTLFGLAATCAEILNKRIIGVQARSRRREPGYDGFLRYRALLRRHQEAVAAAERVTWLQEERWKRPDGWAFEKELSQLLAERGWDVKLTKGSGDEGVDIFLTASERTVIVQCKAHARLIHPGPIRELYGTLRHQAASEAWLVTTSGFSSGAKRFAQGKPIRLMTIKEILDEPEMTSATSVGHPNGD